jgi:hypothetical protein
MLVPVQFSHNIDGLPTALVSPKRKTVLFGNAFCMKYTEEGDDTRRQEGSRFIRGRERKGYKGG